MSHELRIERLYDATPEQVFDAFVDPATQEQLHGAGQEGWTMQRCETDVRVGGTSTYAMGFNGVEPDVEVRVFSVVDRPRRLVFRHSMTVTEWGGRSVDTEMTITFEAQGGKTLLTMVQTGFETAEDRDDFNSGWPTYLDTLGRVVGGVPDDDALKARHDT
ncbi:MAG: SRPBCC family protein [Actinomycetota bacterium]